MTTRIQAGAVGLATFALLATAALSGCQSTISSVGKGSDAAADGGTGAAAAGGESATDQGSGTGAAGGGGSGNSSSDGVCAYLSLQQASAIEKVAYLASQAAPPLGKITSCYYTSPEGQQDMSILVDKGSVCWDSLVDHRGPGTAISGVGDAAFGYDAGMAVKLGATCLHIESNSPADSSGDWGPDTEIAKIVVPKIS